MRLCSTPQVGLPLLHVMLPLSADGGLVALLRLCPLVLQCQALSSQSWVATVVGAIPLVLATQLGQEQIDAQPKRVTGIVAKKMVMLCTSS